MDLKVNVPDIIAQELGDEPEKALLEPWLVKLAKRGDLWTGDIQKILGLSRLETIQWLGERGVPYLDISKEELERGKQNAANARRTDS